MTPARFAMVCVNKSRWRLNMPHSDMPFARYVRAWRVYTKAGDLGLARPHTERDLLWDMVYQVEARDWKKPIDGPD